MINKNKDIEDGIKFTEDIKNQMLKLKQENENLMGFGSKNADELEKLR